MDQRHGLHGTGSQHNVGDYSRISGRDFYEVSAPDSIKVYLATTPSSVLDPMTLESVDLFKHRFGFSVNRVCREQVLAIKHRYDLTDEEIRRLRQSGHLTTTGRQAKIAPALVMPAAGWAYIALLSVMCVLFAVLIWLSPAPTWKQGSGLCVLAAMWFAAYHAIWGIFIRPWGLLKQVGLISDSREPQHPVVDEAGQV